MSSANSPVDVWNPSQYALFEDYRQRPAEDLLNNLCRILSRNNSSSMQIVSPPPPFPPLPSSPPLSTFGSLQSYWPNSAVRFPSVRRVLDLGCGAGVAWRALLTLFPSATIVALDGSAAMLEAGKKKLEKEGIAEKDIQRIEFIEADLIKWCATEGKKILEAPIDNKNYFDVIYSNATLMWIPNHQTILPQLFHLLTPGTGTLAAQLSNNFGVASHLEIRNTLLEGGWLKQNNDKKENEFINTEMINDLAKYSIESSKALAADSQLEGCPDRSSSASVLKGYLSSPRYGSVWPLSDYYRFSRETCLLSYYDCYETNYHHLLHTQNINGNIFHPITEWVKGTSLSPVISAMNNDEKIEFQRLYSQRLLNHYPLFPFDKNSPFTAPSLSTINNNNSNNNTNQSFELNQGTLFPFKRVFMLAVRALKK